MTDMDLKLKISADSKEAEKSLKNTASAADKLKNVFLGLAAGAKEVARSKFSLFVKTAESGLISLAAKSLIWGGELREAIKLEKGFADVNRFFEEAHKNIAAMNVELKSLAVSKLSIPITEIQKLAKISGSMGIAAKDVAGFITISTKAALSFNIPAEQMIEELGKIKASLNITGDNLEIFTDQVKSAADSAKGASTELGILQVLNSGMAAIGTQFGFAANEIVAFSSAMIDTGTSVGISTTSLGSFLGKLQNSKNETDSFKEGLVILGTSAEQLGRDIKDNPVKAVMTLLETMKKLDGETRGDVLQKLMGSSVQQKAAIGSLVNSLGTLKQQLNAVTDETIYAGGVGRAYTEKMETADAKLQLLKNSISLMAAAFINPFLPAIKHVIDALTRFTNFLRTSSENSPFFEIILKSVSIFLSLGGAINLVILLFTPLLFVFRQFGILLLANKALIIRGALALNAYAASLVATSSAAYASSGAMGVLSLSMSSAVAVVRALGVAFKFLVGGTFGLVGIAITALIVGFTYAAEKFSWFKDELHEPAPEGILAEETAAVKRIDEEIAGLRKQATQTKQVVAESFEEIKKRLTALIDANRDNYSRDLKNLEEIERLKLDEVKRSGGGRSKIEQEITQILIASNAAKLALATKHYDKTIALIESTYNAEIKKAGSNTEIVSELSNELAVAKKKSLKEVESFYESSIAKLISLEKGHRDKAIAFQKEIQGIEKSRQDKLLELERVGLSASKIIESKKLELAEKTAETKALIADGQFSKAVEIAKESEKLAFDLAKTEAEAAKAAKKAVDEGNISAREAQKIAREAQKSRVEYNAAVDLTTEALGKASAEETKLADSAKTAHEAQASDLRDVITQLKEVDSFLSSKNTLDVDTSESLKKAEKLKLAIDDAVRRRELTIDILEKQGFKSGGSVEVPGFATGGSPSSIITDSGYLSGAGTGTSDSMLARVSNKEYILNAKATQGLGKNFLDYINFKKFPAFSSGGAVDKSIIKFPSFISPSLSSLSSLSSLADSPALSSKSQSEKQKIVERIAVDFSVKNGGTTTGLFGKSDATAEMIETLRRHRMVM